MKYLLIIFIISLVMVGTTHYTGSEVNQNRGEVTPKRMAYGRVIKVAFPPPTVKSKMQNILDNQTIYGYSSTIDQTDSSPFITASQQRVREGIIANNCKAFGTRVVVGDKEYEVQDRMNSRYGCDVWDIWFETREEALAWGKRIINVEIL